VAYTWRTPLIPLVIGSLFPAPSQHMHYKYNRGHSFHQVHHHHPFTAFGPRTRLCVPTTSTLPSLPRTPLVLLSVLPAPSQHAHYKYNHGHSCHHGPPGPPPPPIRRIWTSHLPCVSTTHSTLAQSHSGLCQTSGQHCVHLAMSDGPVSGDAGILNNHSSSGNQGAISSPQVGLKLIITQPKALTRRA
jgi:hypothetical protein